ncbi:MAG TPA: PAS domain S-box protein, partial [Bacteroidales bacterium]|nr:PAS domain S-box protein [Bacteroidales bacterium]
MAPLTPFILVTGSVNEEVAVECMKAGADDYVLKQNLIRLVPAVKAALEKQQTIRMRQEAEAALRISEERFKQIAEAAGEFIWEIDSDGLYTYVNKISEGILGYSSNEIVGKKHFYDFFVPELAEQLKKDAFQAFADKSGFKRFENANIHKDGHIVILSTTGMPVLDAEGNLLGYRGVDTDITEQKKAELALRESEERFRNLYSNMAEGVCLQKLVFDHHGKAIDYQIIGVNQQYENILGIKQEDVVGKLASEVYNYSPAPYLPVYSSVVNTGIPYTFESFYEPMNKHFSISVSPWDKDGFATIFADITHRVKAEDVLRQERMMLRTLIDHIPDSIFVKDAQGRKIISNPADLIIMQLAT